MECRALPFRQLPHQPEIFLDFLEQFSRVARFYAHPPTMQAAAAEARSLNYPAERRGEVAAVLRAQNARFGAGDAARENLERFAKGAVAVVSGQQVGLFSGPAYAIYKAVSAIHVAQELMSAGIEAVPVFWMATEDHDLDEVRHSTWFDSGKLKRFELPGNGGAGLPVGQIALGPAVREMVNEAAEILSAAGGELAAATLRESYGPQETYGSAFAKLFARLFAEQGLILLDPLDARLHRTGAELLRRAVEQREALSESLLARNKELEKADYGAQVKVTSRSTLLFYMGDGAKGAPSGAGHAGSGVRRPVTANGEKFICGERSWTREDLLAAIEAEPENFSANALLRPVLQDYLLPTAAYIAGPAEIAYLAQAEVLYRKLLGRMTVILPRAAFTLVDAKAEKLLGRYGLSVEDVWRGSQELRRKMERASVPKTLDKNFAATARETERRLMALKKQIARLDPTLDGAVETAGKKITFQLDKLRRKAGKAEALKAGLVSGHQEFLESLLYPHKAEQSRELCFLPFLAAWGPGGLKELVKAAGCRKSSGHKILRIP
ncbi:MAG TPA: bacillithiol biosynthesis cysteine-adding enzyme BshC [Candidatus Acidoferrum sp.]|nr:bacillithiol biosynthesis cysteine-adding enzyme BshC [Candidatus Acidoferrum sp.]